MKTLLGFGLMSMQDFLIVVGLLVILGVLFTHSKEKEAPILRAFNGARWLCAYAGLHGDQQEMRTQDARAKPLEMQLLSNVMTRIMIAGCMSLCVMILLHQLAVYIWFYSR